MAAPAAHPLPVRIGSTPVPETGANAPLTADEFLRLLHEGFFGTKRVELRRGVVILKMATSNLHLKAVAMVLQAMILRFTQEGRFVGSQSNVKLAMDEAPQPDVFVVRGDVQDVKEEVTPDRLLLVIEVSVTSLREDRTEKAAQYARAGIAEYWIVNPAGRQIEIRREPRVGEYTLIQIVDDPGTVSSLFAPQIEFLTGALMPLKKS